MNTLVKAFRLPERALIGGFLYYVLLALFVVGGVSPSPLAMLVLYTLPVAAWLLLGLGRVGRPARPAAAPLAYTGRVSAAM